MLITKRMRGKLEGFWSINTNPLTNSFCQKMAEEDRNICSKCYSNRMLRSFLQSAYDAWDKNGIELSQEDIDPPIILHRFVRLHSHGELINKKHYKNFIKIAEKNPKTIFALWTKRKNIIKKYNHPNNMILIYSDPIINGNNKLPKGFDKVFTVYEKDYAEKNNIDINCGGKKCKNCLLCYESDEKYIRETIR